jgi:cell pole-organizing protein PopZ
MSGAGSMPKSPAGPTGADPAMDDILASIRRILNEDEATSPPPGATAPPAAQEPLELTEAMLVAAPPEPPLPPPSLTAMPAPALPESPPDGMPPLPEGLLAPAVAAATTAALSQLLRSVAAERHAAVHRGGPSIEDVVREELRPLLKTWLDQHLPPIVERLVRVEIERVIGRALP